MLNDDNRLGLIKIGLLLGELMPEKVESLMLCTTLGAIADEAGIPGSELLVATGTRLLQEWLRKKEMEKC